MEKDNVSNGIVAFISIIIIVASILIVGKDNKTENEKSELIKKIKSDLKTMRRKEVLD